MATEKSKKAKKLADISKKFVMLAHSFDPKKHVFREPKNKHEVDIRGWLIQEKIDGVRAIYKNGKLYTRNKKRIYAPERFIKSVEYTLNSLRKSAGIHNIQLDGELVSTKGFQHTTSVVRKKGQKKELGEWKHICYKLFDYKIIKSKKQEKNYDDRMCEIYWNVFNGYRKNEGVFFVEFPRGYGTVTTKNRLYACLSHAEKYEKIEGFILRNPKSYYEVGRSWNMLKLKTFTDIEAEVIKHVPGNGKFKNMLGKVECKMPNGKIFECGNGFTRKDRLNPPDIGSKITVKYFELTEAGLPRFPIYIATRDYE